VNTLIHADIFFFVTTIAVVILTVLLSVISWYVFKILQDIKHISAKAREAAETLEDGLKTLSGSVFSFFLGKILGKSSRKKQDPEDRM